MLKRTLLSTSMIFLLLSNNQVILAETNSPEVQAIQENKVKYEQLDEEAIKLSSNISKLNSDIETLNIELSNNNSELENTEIEISTITNKIEDSKLEIEKKQKLVDNRIRSIYKSNMTTDIISYLVKSENLLDMFNRISSMNKIVSVDKQVITDINEKKDSLSEDIKNIENKQNDLINLKKSIESDLNEINSKKEQQEELLMDLDSRKDEINNIIETNEEQLISHPISIINSEASTISEIIESVNTLESLLPQLNSGYVVELAKDSIELGKEKISNSDSIPATSNKVEDGSNYLATYSMIATAYTGGGFTALGPKPVYNPNGLSTVSVDPKVIPLGSKVYVSGYGYAIASDTGGAIKGNKIDLYMNSEAQCFAFGRQTVTVNVIAYPGEW